MPGLTGLVETALYVDDVKRSMQFYQEVFELEPMVTQADFVALNVAGRQVLLLFRKGSAAVPITTPVGTVPAHDANGRAHIAFSIAASDLEVWKRWLAQKGIAVESTVTWPRGGKSVYVRDPDGHLLELATPGIWPVY